MNLRANQYWTFVGNTISSLQVDTPFCLGMTQAQAGESYGGQLTECDSPAAQFTFDFKHGNSTIFHSITGLCLTIAGKPARLVELPV